MKALKVILILLGIVILLVFAAGAYIKIALPNTGKPEVITIVAAPERVENGRYLANYVTGCMDCHSSRDWSRFAGPIKAAGFGAGGEVFNQDMGFPGTFYAPNITPYALKEWTDGELLHAITTGVSKDGRALFPLMATHRFGLMDREDIYDIIAYIRTLPPVAKDVPKSEADFPVNFFMNTMPKPADFQEKPNPEDSKRYGAYLVNAAGCVDCHSEHSNGRLVEGTEFGGGMAFHMPTGIVKAPNITFDQATGIGKWNKSAFIARFKLYAAANNHSLKVAEDGMNTTMPWTIYGGMKERDLGAIYDFLAGVKPIQKQVIKFTPNP